MGRSPIRIFPVEIHGWDTRAAVDANRLGISRQRRLPGFRRLHSKCQSEDEFKKAATANLPLIGLPSTQANTSGFAKTQACIKAQT
jgi:hypothetical protein